MLKNVKLFSRKPITPWKNENRSTHQQEDQATFKPELVQPPQHGVLIKAIAPSVHFPRNTFLHSQSPCSSSWPLAFLRHSLEQINTPKPQLPLPAHKKINNISLKILHVQIQKPDNTNVHGLLPSSHILYNTDHSVTEVTYKSVFNWYFQRTEAVCF